MSRVRLTQRGLEDLRRAIKRSPRRAEREAGTFIARGIATYNRTIIRNPWRLGQSGGGAPVDTGNLRDTHVRKVETWEGRIKATAPYAYAVHSGEGQRHPRPWLDYAKEKNEAKITQLIKEMLDSIVADLRR